MRQVCKAPQLPELQPTINEQTSSCLVGISEVWKAILVPSARLPSGPAQSPSPYQFQEESRPPRLAPQPRSRLPEEKFRCNTVRSFIFRYARSVLKSPETRKLGTELQFWWLAGTYPMSAKNPPRAIACRIRKKKPQPCRKTDTAQAHSAQTREKKTLTETHSRFLAAQ